MAATPDGKGYWLVASDGGIFAFGDAAFYGSTGALTLNKPIVGMAATPDASAIGLLPATAAFSPSGMPPSRVDRGADPQQTHRGHGRRTGRNWHWLVASDGGIFAFGDAAFYGSTGALTLNKPIVGMAAST